MEFVRRWWWLVLIALLVIGWLLYRPTAPTPRVTASTDLQIEIYGGFAYVPTRPDNRLEIAYLEDTNVPGCVVHQLGVDLMVVGGTIVEPANPPATKMFDLESAVVTFPDLESANLPLTANRGPRPGSPYHPANPNNPPEWEDLQWVPGISPDVPNSSLNPDWRTLVDGRIVLRGGTIKGLLPSDVVVKDSIFEFRKGAAPVYSQAITDRTNYTVKVPSDRVTMLLSNAKSGVTRIVVTPAANQPVSLKLIGRHAAQTPGSLPPGTPIPDFCAFYQLLQPVPPPSDWLIPHLASPAPGPGNLGKPSPGPFCPGDWF